MRVFGRIEDAYTEKPIGAVVTLGVGDTELIQHMPAKDGYFEYEIPSEAIPMDQDVLTCTVEKKGYKTLTTTYTITDEIELAIELVPRVVNWKRVFIVTGIALGSLLLLALIIFAIRYFFFGPKEYPIKTFTLIPAKIKAGEKAELKWEISDAAEVFLGNKNAGETDKVEKTGTQTVTPDQTRKYFLTVTDDDGKQLAQEWRELKIIPPPPQILSFSASPMEINLWESAVLEWKTIGTETIYIHSDPDNKNFRIDPQKVQRERSIIDEDYPETESGEPGGNKKELNGTIEVAPVETTTFTLVAVNSEGVRCEESVEVKVLVVPEITGFTASGTLIDPGESVILKWETHQAEQVFLNGERKAPRFTQEVRPPETTTYTLLARNKTGERQCALTVTVRCPEVPAVVEPPPLEPPRIYRFHISAASIAAGESTVLSWVTDNAEKVYLTAEPVEITGPGPEPPGPGTTTGEKTGETETGTAPAATSPPREIIAGKPLESGQVIRVKPLDSLRVSPTVSTRYQLRAVNPLKEVSWTRTVEVIPNTCTVILYELENYQGEFMAFTTDAAEIGKLDNRVSSIKIIGKCQVKVFSAPHFKATRQEFPVSVPSLRGTWIGNNTISSLQLIDR